jgi:hypothetical protein
MINPTSALPGCPTELGIAGRRSKRPMQAATDAAAAVSGETARRNSRRRARAIEALASDDTAEACGSTLRSWFAERASRAESDQSGSYPAAEK